MYTKLSRWQILGFIFTCIAGVLLHFLFDWSGGSVFVAPFSAVNESIWEHMKLLFFPMFAFALLENRYLGTVYKNFFCVKLIGIAIGTALIPILYYTLNGMLGNLPDWVNIAIFFVCAFISYYIENRLFANNTVSCRSPQSAVWILITVALVFSIVTFFPPKIPLFKDPMTGTYGYWKESSQENLE